MPDPRIPPPKDAPPRPSNHTARHRQARLPLGIAGTPDALAHVEALLSTKARTFHLPLILHPFPLTRESTAEEVLRAARDANLNALHVSGPLCENLPPLLDHISPLALQQGSTDLILFRGGVTHGVDTAGWARKQAFTRFLAPRKRDHALLIGAGQPGRAAALALASAGVKSLAIFDPDRSRALELSLFLTQGSGVRSITLPGLDSLCDRRFDGIISAMPTLPDETRDAAPRARTRPGNLSPRHWVIDTSPQDSGLTDCARRLGCPHINLTDLDQLQARRLLDHLTSANAQPTSQGLRTARPFPYRALR